jgi:hypothetical protein
LLSARALFFHETAHVILGHTSEADLNAATLFGFLKIPQFEFHTRRLAHPLKWSSNTVLDKYSDLKQKLNQLFDRTTLDAIALLIAESKPDKVLSESPPDWMTASQLARYWQLVNTDDEPTTAGIMKWAVETTNTRCRMRTWEISCDSTVRKSICGQEKRLRDDELRAKSES